MSELEDFQDDLDDLASAEDFLNYFEVPYNEPTVHVNRLHILQRFHDYLDEAEMSMPEAMTARRAHYKALLEKAYQDFVASDALTEKVFRVFHMHEAQEVKISVDSLRQQLS
ncbi:nitrogenase-stabilizing/protective protein NifW [Candidatus Albibeggiatoa sp. nov. BB20]|uniref:nitrogenase-stabilizing/protective protein NifW n=1 Tax=Candidatus Albibeggiatoa sp. nov. BB20 TaxID=3162723 RepID=UPI0033656705